MLLLFNQDPPSPHTQTPHHRYHWMRKEEVCTSGLIKQRTQSIDSPGLDLGQTWFRPNAALVQSLFSPDFVVVWTMFSPD